MGMTPIYGTPDPDLAIRTIHRAAELGVEIWADGPERPAEEVNSRFRGLVRQWLVEAFKSGALNFMEAEPDIPAVDRVGEVQAPTLVMAGDTDPIVPISLTDAIVEPLPNHLTRYERFAN